MMNTREEFEKWAKDRGWDLERWGLAYRYPATDNCWIGWQACQALNDKRIAELEEKLDRLLEKLGEQPYEQSAYALITEINQGIKKEIEERK